MHNSEAEIIAHLRNDAAHSSESDAIDLEERRAMSMGSVPEAYLDAWARLQCQKPTRVSDVEWQRALGDAGRFLAEWGSLAAEFEWSPGDILDVPGAGKRPRLVWWLSGETATALGPEYAATGDRVFGRITRAEWQNPKPEATNTTKRVM